MPVAAIFAHPDDEVLGAGGAIAFHAARQDDVHVMLMAVGLEARGPTTKAQMIELRSQAERAADTLGAKSITFGDFPDNAMDTLPLLDVVKHVETFLSEHSIETIYTHHGGDLNIDHRIVHQAVLTACRPLPSRVGLHLLAGEIPSSTEWAVAPLAAFSPTNFLDISSTLATKLEALACYASELREWPHPRSLRGVETLARWRGCQSGLDAAEAFITLRSVHHDIG